MANLSNYFYMLSNINIKSHCYILLKIFVNNNFVFFFITLPTYLLLMIYIKHFVSTPYFRFFILKYWILYFFEILY